MSRFPHQQTLFGEPQPRRVVNVASVPQRSPFRYPGGKTWLVPRIRDWLSSLPTRPTELIEPFAGGGIVSLTAAAENLSDRATMVEIDEQIAAVWKTILGGDGEWLANVIATFDVTSESVKEMLSQSAGSTRERAFQTILKNRTYHGGILAPGSAPVRHGENGKGIRSRWYPKTLRKRISQIVALRDRITFIEGDGIEVVQQNARRTDVVFFVDPPYIAAGKKAGSRLYTHFTVDHEKLFAAMRAVTGDFLMTYDAADGVRDLARKHGFDVELIAMKNTHHAKMNELLIGRNLDWAR
ncbi:MAG: DNA adenine methylase [Acidobacteriota bacterium]|nr:DNA adenine methylase [Acidobacteriota bacterium]